jgi:hypothetical protein
MPRFHDADISIRSVLSEAFARLRERFSGFVLIYLVIFGPFVVGDYLDAFEPLGEWGPTAIFSFLAPLADGAVLLLLLRGAEAGIGDALVGGLRYYFRLLAVRLLRTLGILAGAMAAVVPGLLLATWFSLSDVVAIEEDTQDPFRALFRSRDLVRGHTIPVFAAFAPVVIPFQVGGLLVLYLGGGGTAEAADWTYPANIFLDLIALTINAVSLVIYERLEEGELEEEGSDLP